MSAQNLPIDNEQQLQQAITKARASGMTDKQIMDAAKARGANAEQLEILQRKLNSKNTSPETNSADTALQPSARKLNYRADSSKIGKKLNEQKNIFTLPVFGSDLFSETSSTFEPNLNLATPVNYTVGPNDQLNINVSGRSVVNWKLQVSPEGNINIPGIGMVPVAGKTMSTATALIKSKLQANRFAIGNGSNLSVTLGDIRSIKVIMTGQLKRPGTYTLPSLATAFNALYAAGGPGELGSYRNIEIIRNNHVLRRLDVYDFLTKGDQESNISLQDQDIIRVPSYQIQVELGGQVKTPAKFEMLPGETLAHLLRFAGGFTNEAYTEKIKVDQVSEQQRRLSDIPEQDYKNYQPLRGDRFFVDRIIDRYINRVTISGAVFRPGTYALEKGMNLSSLISKASGLKEDAFPNRGIITRLKPDNTKEIISFDPSAIKSGKDPDITLLREDSVVVPSIFDLRDTYKVRITGEVRQPGEYNFGEKMTVEDLIIKAGGFSQGASGMRIEVARRITDSDPTAANSAIAKIFTVNVNNDLQSTGNFSLQPYDVVSVYPLPGFEKQRLVKVQGEVLYPGTYAIQHKNEKISDLIKRAGGLTASADAEGGTMQRKMMALNSTQGNGADSLALQRAQQLNRLKILSKDSTQTSAEQLVNNRVGIQLADIIAKPGSVSDIPVEDGDVLIVPQQQRTVRVNGEVLYPGTVVFERGKSLSDYIDNAGGFGPRAYKGKTYVVYPNGTVKSTRHFLFFKSYPQVKAGSDILVPKKPERKGLTTAELVGVTSALASLAAIVLGIISLHK
ncbi:SLBB domain-containing protein [Mucilaginibacter lutimaris]|uniref:SLBB domain-containing protein n=1 Tax=Mucilaginibacter lutimaris TaxID=931629 RepID=A0ABW2ZES9_9SPHI